MKTFLKWNWEWNSENYACDPAYLTEKAVPGS